LDDIENDDLADVEWNCKQVIVHDSESI
jgi:hypothetical protein